MTPIGRFTSLLSQSDGWSEIAYFFEHALDTPAASLIEFLLIGGVVYAILRSLEGTRGARLLRAVLMILVFSFALVWLVAERFKLDRINALYPYFILAVFLVSLVAFQTELRRLLLQFGEAVWLRRWFGASEDVVDAVVTAVERLSKRKIGALIAIERSDECGAFAETGVRLDASVSAELLETIFWPGSALHDLGVIISQDRVRAASCQFPLAESEEVERSLGSRHRAALGMSHETDAVVIVVSEETGTVSAAFGGRLRRFLSPDALRRLLIENLHVVTSESPTSEAEPAAGVALSLEADVDDAVEPDAKPRPASGSPKAGKATKSNGADQAA